MSKQKSIDEWQTFLEHYIESEILACYNKHMFAVGYLRISAAVRLHRTGRYMI
jgi:hypothetical protein